MNQFFASSASAGLFLTVAAYFAGTVVKKKLKLAIFNPLLVGSILIIVFLISFGIDFESYNQGGQYFGYLLTPATVCLAIPLYQKLDVLKKNAAAIMAGVFSGSAVNLISVFLLSLLFGLNHEQYVTLLPKSVTGVIAMGISEELGGAVPVTVAALIVTGIGGNIIGEGVCRLFRIKSPIARGLALGTASHAMGTARALEMGVTEGAMAGLAIAVAGLLTVVLAPLFALLL